MWVSTISYYWDGYLYLEVVVSRCKGVVKVVTVQQDEEWRTSEGFQGLHKVKVWDTLHLDETPGSSGEFRLVLYVTKSEITARSQCQSQDAAVEQRPDSKNETRMKRYGENKKMPRFASIARFYLALHMLLIYLEGIQKRKKKRHHPSLKTSSIKCSWKVLTAYSWRKHEKLKGISVRNMESYEWMAWRRDLYSGFYYNKSGVFTMLRKQPERWSSKHRSYFIPTMFV